MRNKLFSYSESMGPGPRTYHLMRNLIAIICGIVASVTLHFPYEQGRETVQDSVENAQVKVCWLKEV